MEKKTAAFDPSELDPRVKPFWVSTEMHRVGMGHQTAVLKAIAAGEIPVVKIGHKNLIPTSWIRRQIGLPDVTGDDTAA